MSATLGYSTVSTANSNPVAPGAGARELGLPRAVGDLEHAVAELEDTVKTLVERLIRCVVPPPPPEMPIEKRLEAPQVVLPACEYAQAIHVKTERITATTQTVQALLSNLDV